MTASVDCRHTRRYPCLHVFRIPQQAGRSRVSCSTSSPAEADRGRQRQRQSITSASSEDGNTFSRRDWLRSEIACLRYPQYKLLRAERSREQKYAGRHCTAFGVRLSVVFLPSRGTAAKGAPPFQILDEKKVPSGCGH